MKKQCNLKPPAPCFLPVLSRMAGCTLADPGIHGHMVSYVETLVGRQVRGEGPRTLGVGCDSENSSWGTIRVSERDCQPHTQREDIGHGFLSMYLWVTDSWKEFLC